MTSGAPFGGTLTTPLSVPVATERRLRLGVLGTFVWDIIYGRDPRDGPVEEWGGITYALGALDAALPPEWEIVPVMKVGADLAALRPRLSPDAPQNCAGCCAGRGPATQQPRRAQICER